MANRHRGEIDAVLDGIPHRLVMTLGALAELESAFGDSDMLALIGRFERGRLSARDCVRIIGAGLRGAGSALRDDDVAKMKVEGGAAGYVDIVARLLTATFGSDDMEAPSAASGTATTAPDRSQFGGGGAAREDHFASPAARTAAPDGGLDGGEAAARTPFPGET